MFVTGPAAIAASPDLRQYTKAFAPLTDTQVHLVAGGSSSRSRRRAIDPCAGRHAANSVDGGEVLALALLAVLIFTLGNAHRGAFAHPVAWTGVSTSSFFTALIAVLLPTRDGWSSRTSPAR
jgi:hypothetical protein